MLVLAEKSVPDNSAQPDANDVKTGSAPDEPVQIPDFTATDQLGNEVSLEQIKVRSCRGFKFRCSSPWVVSGSRQ